MPVSLCRGVGRVCRGVGRVVTMPNDNDSLKPLRDALAVSPDNLPLRQHLAETLLRLGRYAEAEQEFRAAIALAPDNQAIKLALATTFHRQGKQSHALVLLEDLVKGSSPSPAALVLHARLLLDAGDVRQAVHQYREAVAADPDVEDEKFAALLGIEAEEDDEVEDGRVRLGAGDDDDEDAVTSVPLERPKINFSDVGGMDALKEEIRLKIIYPITHPELYRAYGKTIGGGILMYGPPGCGKTYLARATAGEINANFLAVGINDVLDMWLGNSERNLHELFERARDNQPCVLFFDEVDALGASRTDMKHSAGRHLINQFLAELDGVGASNEGVLMLAATNTPWHLDAAFRRPGRFDRIVFVPPPDAKARGEILQVLCQGKPIDSIDFDQVVKKCEGFSGADLKALLDQAIETKLQEAMRHGVPQPLVTKDLLNAARVLRPTTKEWFSTARNYALYSNQGGMYDDILKYLKM